MSAPAPAPAAAPIPAPSRAPLPPPARAPAPAPTAAPLALPTAAPRPACVAHPARSTSTATQPLVVLRIFIPLETHIESGRRCTKGPGGVGMRTPQASHAGKLAVAAAGLALCWVGLCLVTFALMQRYAN